MNKPKVVFLTGLGLATLNYKMSIQNSGGYFEPPEPGSPTEVSIQKSKTSFNIEISGTTISSILEDSILETYYKADETQWNEHRDELNTNRKSKQVFCIKSLVHLVKWVYLTGFHSIIMHKIKLTSYILKLCVYCRMRMKFWSGDLKRPYSKSTKLSDVVVTTSLLTGR